MSGSKFIFKSSNLLLISELYSTVIIKMPSLYLKLLLMMSLKSKETVFNQFTFYKNVDFGETVK